ncbi:MAG: S49 family peptidase, partial [Proteobacteria bacterium]|nr:S49 family peptidase [Pseudomonadota bacterium]
MGQTRLFIGRNQAMGAEKKRGLIGRLWHGLFVIVTSYLALVGLLVTVLSILFAVFLAKAIKQQDNGSSPKSVLNSSPPINNSFLRIKIDRPVIARRLDEKEKFLSQIFSDTLPISLQDLETALLRASDDARVHGVMLELSNGSADFSTVTALRRALGQFSESKKPIYASLDEGDTLHYYLASVGNKISLSPLGGLNITGPAFQLTYFGSALEKLGIQLEVLRAGKFKSAMESFIQDQPSAETLEMYQALEKSLRGTVATAIATSRKHSESEVDKWLKQSFFTSSEALKAGLVDRVGYLPEWEDEVKTEQKLDSIVDMKAYLHDTAAKGEARLAKSKEAIGLIEAEGEIGMGASNTRNSIDPEHIIEELHWAAEQDEIKAVVLRVNSPGGSALASDLIWNEVRKLAAKKPLVVSMGAVAASGGYYISAPAALILAEPTSITGSIGVIGAIPKGLKFAEKWGVNFHMVTASDRKDYLNFGTKSSEEDKNLLRASIKSTYDIFVQKVAEGRK